MVTPQSQNVHKLPQKRINQSSPNCWHRHQLHLTSIAATQIGVHRRLGRVPDSKM